MNTRAGDGETPFFLGVGMCAKTGNKKWSKYFFLPATLYTFEENPKILSS